MANETEWTLGTEYVMESNGGVLTSATTYAACADATFETTQVGGWPFAVFELDIPGFSVAPTAGCRVDVFERKFNSDGNQGPEVDSSYEHDLIGTFYPDLADAAQYLSLILPIHYFGADYYVLWTDGAGGSANLDTAWALRVTPITKAPGS